MELVYPYGSPTLSGVIKTCPEDFKVTENLGFEPSGQGEHLFILVEKTGLTTPQLIEQLARQIGIKPRLFGYSGLKDKQAITCQWISIHLPGMRHIPVIPDTDQYRVLDTTWHDKKLRIGVHKSNHFEVVVKEIKGQSDNLEQSLDMIRQHGFANYFGEQRFGQQGDNVEQALSVLNNRHKLKRLSRHKRSLYISALRSELFNRILSQRIQRGIWREPVEGDVFTLAGSHSFFVEELNDEISRRYQDMDIHSSISLYGSGQSPLTGQAALLEQSVFNAATGICETLMRLEVRRAMRPTRAIAENLRLQLDAENNIVQVNVELAKGSYLTSLLQHLILSD